MIHKPESRKRLINDVLKRGSRENEIYELKLLNETRRLFTFG